jgi:hypothetical protein
MEAAPRRFAAKRGAALKGRYWGGRAYRSTTTKRAPSTKFAMDDTTASVVGTVPDIVKITAASAGRTGLRPPRH